MTVEVLLFAAMRDIAGSDQVVIDLPDTATFAELREGMRMKYPQLGPLIHFCRIAEGGSMVADEQQVRPNTRIALIPPVSGG